jgi:hypothetical protein
MAKPFKPIGTSGVKVLARLAARNAIKQQLRDEGIRVSLVPAREIEEKAREYLANHPELYAQARERAERMGWIDPPGILSTPDWWFNRSVTYTGSAKPGTDKSG